MTEQTFKFTEDVFVDRDPSTRIKITKGTTFTAVLDREVLRGRPTSRDPDPKPTLGNPYVVSSDIAVLSGCLTSCIRVGRCIPIGPAKELAQ